MKRKKTILITGSSRGIGKAIAELACKQGYRVIVHGKTDSKELKAVHKKLKGSLKIFFNVADKDAAHKVIKEVLKEIRTIDVLVNNAGVARNFLKDINEVDEDKALEEYKTNILGAIYCIQAVLPGMLKKRFGSVINIGSIKGVPELSTLSTLTFASTKAGLVAITKALSKAYSDKGVRFNVIEPGYVETDQVKLWNKQTFRRINKGTILGRMAKPEEIAPLVIFLASDESSYMIGSEILIDGGLLLKEK